MKKRTVAALIKWILDKHIDELDKMLRERGKHIHENPKKGKVGRARKPKVEVSHEG